MTDNFLGIVNCLNNKYKSIVIAPAACEPLEFDDNFFQVINEKIYSNGGCCSKIINIIKLIKFIKKYEYDKLNIFFMNQTIWNLIILLFVKFNRVVVWLHDPRLHSGATLKERIVKLFIDKYYLKRVDKIIVSYKGALNELGNNKDKGMVIYLPEMIVQEYEDIKNRDTDIEYDYIFFGRIEPYKGIEILLKAFSKLDNKLLIVGKGSMETYVNDKVKGHNNITFINEYVSNRKLATYIKKSKFVILPYKDATGTQTVQLANYYGKLALATNVGCFTEYITEKINGFYIDECSVEGVCNAIGCLKEIEPHDYEEGIRRKFAMFNIKNITRKLEDVVIR
ncbi:glycosyltransferase [Selenomonas ruminantium]|uniref:glycosyltransferase n=1 Tax=Selenomonas ruminantium TaxID=971 RepID=UPI0026EFB0D1|nr:glycosyltransferase [Selenomonas ruminantium]